MLPLMSMVSVGQPFFSKVYVRSSGCHGVFVTTHRVRLMSRRESTVDKNHLLTLSRCSGVLVFSSLRMSSMRSQLRRAPGSFPCTPMADREGSRMPLGRSTVIFDCVHGSELRGERSR